MPSPTTTDQQTEQTAPATPDVMDLDAALIFGDDDAAEPEAEAAPDAAPGAPAAEPRATPAAKAKGDKAAESKPAAEAEAEGDKPGADESGEEQESDEPAAKLERGRLAFEQKMARKARKELDARAAELEVRERRAAEQERALADRQRSTLELLQRDPLRALQELGHDPEQLYQRLTRQYLGKGEPEPWQRETMELRSELQKLHQTIAERDRKAAEERELSTLRAQHIEGVRIMVDEPERPGSAERWPHLAALTREHRAREIESKLEIARQRGFTGSRSEFLDALEELIPIEYPYIAAKTAAALTGRAGDTRADSRENPPGNGARTASRGTSAALPDAVTPDLATETSGKRRAASERQRRAEADAILQAGIVDD